MEEFFLLDQLNKSKGFNYALITTYNFDIGFFERTVLNSLYSNDIRKVSVFVDATELNKALDRVPFSSIGKRYVANPIRINATFHPKVILLLGDSQAVLFIGSGNITYSGYYLNNEVFNQFIFNDKHPENASIIYAAYLFFKKLDSISYGLDSKLLEEIDRLPYLRDGFNNSELWLFENMEEPILSQLKRVVNASARIDVVVPYYDNELKALNELKVMYPESEIHLYLQNRNCRISLERLEQLTIGQKIIAFQGFKDQGNDNFYHGKVFRLISGDDSYILYGSANCTESALCKTYKDGGNIECSVLEKGAAHDFDYFFENLVEDQQELDCVPLKYEVPENRVFYFQYGINQGVIKLYFGSKKHTSIQRVKYRDLDLRWTENDDQLIVELSLEDIPEIDSIFSISIVCEDIEEEIKCWIIDPLTLELNRKVEAKGELYNFDIDDDDRFIEDRINVINALAVGALEEAKKQSVYDQVMPQETEEDDESDEESPAVVDYVIPPSGLFEEYKKYEFVKTLQSKFLTRFLSGFDRDIRTNQAGCEKVSEINEIKRTARQPSSSEVRFSRFIKTTIRKYLDGQYKLSETFSHYLFITTVFVDIFEKYLVYEKVQGLFEERYVFEKIQQMVDLALTVGTEQVSSEEKESIILIGLLGILGSVVFLNDDENEKWTVQSRCENSLSLLNDVFQLRTNYRQYIGKVAMRLNEYKDEIISENSAINILENLFRYKPIEQVIQIFIADYGPETTVEYNDEKVSVKTVTKDYSMRIKSNSLQELRRLFLKTGKYRFLDIIKENIKEYSTPKPGIWKYIEFKVDVKEKSGKKTVLRQSGTCDDPEPITYEEWM